jgi:hypothetical protein
MYAQIAIFLVGLTTPATVRLVIPSLVLHIVQSLGPENVDFFVHTSPLHNMTMQSSEVLDLYESGLGEQLRVDPVDGRAYSLKSFQEVYGVCVFVWKHTNTHTHTHTNTYVYIHMYI